MERKELEQNLIRKAWSDSNYKNKLLSDPKAVLEQELGQSLPETLLVSAVEETSNTVYIRIPRNPEELSDSELDNVAGGLGLGGLTTPSVPETPAIPVTPPNVVPDMNNTCNNFTLVSI